MPRTQGHSKRRCGEFFRTRVCWFSLLKLSFNTFLREIPLITQTSKLTATLFCSKMLNFQQMANYLKNNKDRVSLQHAAVCSNKAVNIIERGHLIRHGAIAINKLTNVIFIVPKCY